MTTSKLLTWRQFHTATLDGLTRAGLDPWDFMGALELIQQLRRRCVDYNWMEDGKVPVIGRGTIQLLHPQVDSGRVLDVLMDRRNFTDGLPRLIMTKRGVIDAEGDYAIPHFWYNLSLPAPILPYLNDVCLYRRRRRERERMRSIIRKFEAQEKEKLNG